MLGLYCRGATTMALVLHWASWWFGVIQETTSTNPFAPRPILKTTARLHL